MGWFDGDNKDKVQTPVEMPRTLAPAPAMTRATADAGSVIGERVQLQGTIISDEDLAITGAVEGTIHARQNLLIAKDAKVKAVVHGRRVQLDGTLQGDVHASEMVVLGATAVMIGNVSTPALQVRDGAFLKGSVEMAGSEANAAARASTAPSRPETARARTAGAVGATQQAKLPAASGAGS